MAEVISYIERLIRKTEELKKLVEESTKTKTEIKSVTRDLVSTVTTLNKKVEYFKVS